MCSLRAAAGLVALALLSCAGGNTGAPGAGGTGGLGGAGGHGGAGGAEHPFTEPAVLSSPAHGTVAGAPALAVDGTGNAVALFVAGGGLWSVRLPADDGAPGAATRVDVDGAGSGPALVALGDAGQGHAVWMAADGGIDGATFAPATGFGPVLRHLDAADQLALVELDVDPEGDAVTGLSFFDPAYGLWNLGFSRRDAEAATWTPAAGWASQRIARSDLAIARIDPYLSIVGAWVDHHGRSWALTIDVDRRTGQFTQSSGTALDLGAAGEDHDLRVVFDGEGEAHAVWRRVADDGEHVEVQRRTNWSWGERVAIGKAAPGRPPVLAASRDRGGAAVAFIDEAGDVRVARLDGTTWITELSHDAAGALSGLSLASGPGGALHLAFLEGAALRVMERRPEAAGWSEAVLLDAAAASPVLRAGGAAVHLVWVRAAAGEAPEVWAARHR